MVQPPPHPDGDTATASDGQPELVHDPLDMLVTSEPVTELDDALRCLSGQLRQACRRHDSAAAARLRNRIDGRLDERNTFRPR